MNNLVRTTITLPMDLYEQLRLQAFQQNTSFSGIIRKKINVGSKTKIKGGIMSLAGKYHLGGKEFKREEFDDELIRYDVARGLYGSGRPRK